MLKPDRLSVERDAENKYTESRAGIEVMYILNPHEEASIRREKEQQESKEKTASLSDLNDHSYGRSLQRSDNVLGNGYIGRIYNHPEDVHEAESGNKTER